jgi:tRNA C32,U32 (ribose-2'-O)-methylase TrmJ
MRHLEHRIDAKIVGVVAVLVAGGDHQEAEADNVEKSVRDLIGRARVFDTVDETICDAKALLDLTERQNAPVRRQQPAIESRDNGLSCDWR